MRVYSAGGRFHGFFRLHSGFGHCIVGWEGSVGAETGKLREVWFQCFYAAGHNGKIHICMRSVVIAVYKSGLWGCFKFFLQ